MSLHPVFSFRLNQTIRAGPVAFGKFDGIHVCLTAATSTDKVLIHSPHKKLGAANNRVAWSDSNYDVALLNFNQPITAIATGCMSAVQPLRVASSLGNNAADATADAAATTTPTVPAISKEVLVIGSPTHVLAYMVDDNSDLFYNEIAGGVSRILISSNSVNAAAGATFGAAGGEPLIILGGADCVRAFDRSGATERFWVLVDGTVTALALIDVNRDGRLELVVGTHRGHIGVYRCGEEAATATLSVRLAYECVENGGSVSALVRVDRSHWFAYTLADGTLGVYEEATRLWRIRSKNRVTALASYNLLGGAPSATTPVGGVASGSSSCSQLIVGWDSGKIDVRDPASGDVLYKLPPLNGPCVALGQADYRGIGSVDLVLCSAAGEVRGYERSKVNLQQMRQQHHQPAEQAELGAMLALKRQLQAELAHYETNVRFNKEQQRHGDDQQSLIHSGADTAAGGVHSSSSSSTSSADASAVGIIPANTRLQIAIYTNIDDPNRPRIEIKIATNNATVVRAALIFAEGIFADGAETYIAYPAERGVAQVIVPMVLPRDIGYDILIKALVGHAHNPQQFHVFELQRQLPPFAMYSVLEPWLDPRRMFAVPPPPAFRRMPDECVRFVTTERFQRIMLWINQNFLLTSDFDPDASAEIEVFRVHMFSVHDRSPVVLDYRNGRELALHTESIQLAGDFVQSLARFLRLDELQTVANFPRVEQQVCELFRKVDGLQATYVTLSTDMAEKKNVERGLIVRIEDARLYHQESLSGIFGTLRTVTEDLISTHTIRQRNFAEIQRSLEAINAILKAASKLRVGEPAVRMMNFLKDAVKAKNISAINKIISTGIN